VAIAVRQEELVGRWLDPQRHRHGNAIRGAAAHAVFRRMQPHPVHGHGHAHTARTGREPTGMDECAVARVPAAGAARRLHTAEADSGPGTKRRRYRLCLRTRYKRFAYTTWRS
jgi:hypothetical protein